MDTKLYVGNLSFDTTEDELRALFAGAGTVTSVMLVKDRETGRSKGFAFVEMGSQAEAEAAIRMFNGTSVGNRDLKVDKARPQEDRRGSFNKGGYDRGSYQDRNRRGGNGPRRY